MFLRFAFLAAVLAGLGGLSGRAAAATPWLGDWARTPEACARGMQSDGTGVALRVEPQKIVTPYGECALQLSPAANGTSAMAAMSCRTSRGSSVGFSLLDVKDGKLYFLSPSEREQIAFSRCP